MSLEIKKQAFKKTLIDFIDSLLELFPSNPDLILTRVYFIKEESHPDTLIEYVQSHLLPLKSMVKSRDEDFFLENEVLFESLDHNKVGFFKKQWSSLDEENKLAIWRWVDAIIVRCERCLVGVVG